MMSVSEVSRSCRFSQVSGFQPWRTTLLTLRHVPATSNLYLKFSLDCPVSDSSQQSAVDCPILFVYRLLRPKALRTSSNMLRKVTRREDGEYVLDSDDPDGMRICGKVDPANDPADYVGRFDITGYLFHCIADYTSKHPIVVNIKFGEKGQIMKYDHMKHRGWVKVVFKLNSGIVMLGHVPIAYLAVSTTHLLEDWLSFCKQDSSRIEKLSAAGSVELNPSEAFTRVSVANEMDVFFRGLSAVTLEEENDAVNRGGNEIESKRKVYYSTKSDGHFDDRHDLCLTTPSNVGPPPGTQGYFLVEIMRHRTLHPYRYCTTGDFPMWPIEVMVKTAAFAFLYETETGWKKLYFRGEDLTLLDEDVPRSFSNIFIVWSFAMFLKRVRVPSHRLMPALAWIPNFGVADVWRLSHKDLNQDYTIVKLTRVAPTVFIANLHCRPRAELHRHLDSLGCQTIVDARDFEGLTRGWRSRNSRNLSQIKIVMDMLAAGGDGHTEDGKQVENMKLDNSKGRPYELCIMMGYDCAFERDIRLFTKNKATDELAYAEALMRDLSPLHWLPEFDPNPIIEATFLGLATGMTG